MVDKDCNAERNGYYGSWDPLHTDTPYQIYTQHTSFIMCAELQTKKCQEQKKAARHVKQLKNHFCESDILSQGDSQEMVWVGAKRGWHNRHLIADFGLPLLQYKPSKVFIPGLHCLNGMFNGLLFSFGIQRSVVFHSLIWRNLMKSLAYPCCEVFRSSKSCYPGTEYFTYFITYRKR